MNQIDTSAVVSQRYAYATVALVVGLLSFVNLFGFEKSLLAIVLGIKALGRDPAPALDARRSWATSAVVLGAVQMSLVVTIVLLNLDRIPKIIAAFRALSDGGY